MPSKLSKPPSKGREAARPKAKKLSEDQEALEGLALILGFIKWCGFLAWGVCIVSGSLAWPLLAIGLAAWAGAGWAKRRANRAYERVFGPTPPPMPPIYVPPDPPRRRPSSSMESILIGVFLGGLFFGGDDDCE